MRTAKSSPFAKQNKLQTIEDLIKEGRIAGIPFFDVYNYTQGEIKEFVEAKNEADRRDLKNQSVIASRHAMLVCANVAGADAGKIYDVFPFWTDEEINEYRLAEVYSFFQRNSN